jgi:hypothetical protein
MQHMLSTLSVLIQIIISEKNHLVIVLGETWPPATFWVIKFGVAWVQKMHH